MNGLTHRNKSLQLLMMKQEQQSHKGILKHMKTSLMPHFTRQVTWCPQITPKQQNKLLRILYSDVHFPDMDRIVLKNLWVYGVM